MYVPLLLSKRCLLVAYLRGIREIIVLAFFLVFLGVVYQVCLSMAPVGTTELIGSYPEAWPLSELLVSHPI